MSDSIKAARLTRPQIMEALRQHGSLDRAAGSLEVSRDDLHARLRLTRLRDRASRVQEAQDLCVAGVAISTAAYAAGCSAEELKANSSTWPPRPSRAELEADRQQIAEWGYV